MPDQILMTSHDSEPMVLRSEDWMIFKQNFLEFLIKSQKKVLEFEQKFNLKSRIFGVQNIILKVVSFLSEAKLTFLKRVFVCLFVCFAKKKMLSVVSESL